MQRVARAVSAFGLRLAHYGQLRFVVNAIVRLSTVGAVFLKKSRCSSQADRAVEAVRVVDRYQLISEVFPVGDIVSKSGRNR